MGEAFHLTLNLSSVGVTYVSMLPVHGIKETNKCGMDQFKGDNHVMRQRPLDSKMTEKRETVVITLSPQ